MALKGGSSKSVGVTDLAFQLQAFELVNKCRVTVALTGTEAGMEPDVVMDVRAWPPEGEPPEVQPLGSSKFSLGAQGFQRMEAAILFGLYQIDFILAEGEFSRTIK